MDFFQHQDDARRRTSRLVLLFVLAVVALLVGLNVAAAFALGSQGTAYSPAVAAMVTLGGAAVIAGGTLFRLASLRGGGRVVAEGLGGRLVTGDSTRDPKERQLLNVVEEIAIASGAAIPGVYILEAEPGINAFAAGWDRGDGVIGVTQGALDKLSRDELQGVIAHEFSHLLHGDARLNVRLMGVLFGILLLGLIGQMMLRSLYFSGGRRSSRQGGGAIFVVVAIGAALMVLGYAGTFFGDLIKAAVSRQREFLADAAAVQYTRQPLGIAGALMKIGGLREGSLVEHRGAPEASHLFFGAGTRRAHGGMFATHPPLEERVVRLVPSLAGRLTKAFRGDRSAMSALQHGAAGLAGAVPDSAEVPPATSAIDQTGEPTPAHVARARAALAELPADLRHAASEPFGAQALVLALLLAPAGGSGARERTFLSRVVPAPTLTEVDRRLPQLAPLGPMARHALLDLALAGLESLSDDQRELLLVQVDAVTRADGVTSAYEAAVRELVAQRGHGRREKGAPREWAKDAAVLLRLVARSGTDESEAAARALAVGWRELGFDDSALAAGGADGDPAEALSRLARRPGSDRRKLLRAAAAVVEADGRLEPAEVELFRLIAEALDAPVPPVLPGQRLGAGAAAGAPR